MSQEITGVDDYDNVYNVTFVKDDDDSIQASVGDQICDSIKHEQARPHKPDEASIEDVAEDEDDDDNDPTILPLVPQNEDDDTDSKEEEEEPEWSQKPSTICRSSRV